VSAVGAAILKVLDADDNKRSTNGSASGIALPGVGSPGPEQAILADYTAFFFRNLYIPLKTQRSVPTFHVKGKQP
jgi:hypothetical protein